ncbi:putative prophage Lp2 protein 6 [Edwardsiella piscicida]|nr:putative prophage Lp2 protein 6 [Edwardsiella piscicida]
MFNKVIKIIRDEVDVRHKDAEPYFSVLFEGKANRWILRFYDKKSLCIVF